MQTNLLLGSHEVFFVSLCNTTKNVMNAFKKDFHNTFEGFGTF